MHPITPLESYKNKQPVVTSNTSMSTSSDMSVFELGEDLLTGQALPLLFDLYYTSHPAETAWGTLVVCVLIIAGACLPTVLSHLVAYWQAPVSDEAINLVQSPAKTWLSASVLFRLVHSLDPDVGTRICVIPFGCLLCLQWGDTTVYRKQSQLIMSCVTVLVLVYITVKMITSPDIAPPHTRHGEPSPSLMAYIFLVADAAFATTHSNPYVAVFRTAVYTVFAAVRRTVVTLLVQNASDSHLYILTYGNLLLLACVLHSSEMQTSLIRLGIHKPTRANILVNVLITMAAVEFRWSPGSHYLASLVSVLTIVVQCFQKTASTA